MFGVNEENYWAESSSAKIANDVKMLTISTKKYLRRCSTGFQMCLRLDVQ